MQSPYAVPKLRLTSNAPNPEMLPDSSPTLVSRDRASDAQEPTQSQINASAYIAARAESYHAIHNLEGGMQASETPVQEAVLLVPTLSPRTERFHSTAPLRSSPARSQWNMAMDASLALDPTENQHFVPGARTILHAPHHSYSHGGTSDRDRASPSANRNLASAIS